MGGAVQTGRITGWIHGFLFDLAFIHLLYTTYLQHLGFKENVVIISALMINEDVTTNNSLA